MPSGGRRSRRIRCAYCKSEFRDSRSWSEHIPCPESTVAGSDVVAEREQALILD
ncbi:MAG TPA: hypothetical protein VL945_01970 [Candidatus Saccharimonadales bacterium]|nr:hypothetical protein [Candidatus Saccharimonadales bacterium]